MLRSCITDVTTSLLQMSFFFEKDIAIFHLNEPRVFVLWRPVILFPLRFVKEGLLEETASLPQTPIAHGDRQCLQGQRVAEIDVTTT